MIARVAKVGVCVADQQKALDFYTGVLGFTVVTDQPMGPDARWIEVAPAGSPTSLALWTPPGLEGRIGTFAGIVFSCEDIQATYAELRDRGVEFEQEPTAQAGGTMAVFVDQDHNSFVLRAGT
jgi:catechol 2,3-dioxygenase-like lactoylglutathione lyase family enzyme